MRRKLTSILNVHLLTQYWIKQNPDYMKKFASFELHPIDIL